MANISDNRLTTITGQEYRHQARRNGQIFDFWCRRLLSWQLEPERNVGPWGPTDVDVASELREDEIKSSYYKYTKIFCVEFIFVYLFLIATFRIAWRVNAWVNLWSVFLVHSGSLSPFGPRDASRKEHKSLTFGSHMHGWWGKEMISDLCSRLLFAGKGTPASSEQSEDTRRRFSRRITASCNESWAWP